MSNIFVLKQNEKYFQNVSGNDIKLIINYYETKRSCVEIIVQDISKKNSKQKSGLICAIVVMNILSLYFNLINEIVFLVLFSIVSGLIVNLLLQVKIEKLLIVKSLGIQITVLHYIGTQSTHFISWDTIEKIFINEVITLQRVLYFLTIMTKNDENIESLVPLFKHTRPRLKCLEIIYEQMEDILS